MQLRPIAVDVDVFRFLESRRSSFDQTHNDILREVIGLPPVNPSPSSDTKPEDSNRGAWSWKGVTLPSGTQLRMSYNGRIQTGEVAHGAWHVAGAFYRTPSAAAAGVARSKDGNPVSLNGWLYWDVKRPADDDWIPIKKLEPPRHRHDRDHGSR